MALSRSDLSDLLSYLALESDFLVLGNVLERSGVLLNVSEEQVLPERRTQPANLHQPVSAKVGQNGCKGLLRRRRIVAGAREGVR